MPNKIYFYAANTPGVHQEWTVSHFFSYSPAVTLTEPNPVYVFNDTGSYWVCLRTISPNGCVKIYCEEIFIADTSTQSQCLLQAYPNPVHNKLYVNLELVAAGQIHIAVFNTQNVLMLQQTKHGIKGNNKIDINVTGLVPGMYVMRLIYGDKVCYARFQKI